MLRERAQRVDQLMERLPAAMSSLLRGKEHRLRVAAEKLKMLDPLGVLRRGYSVVRRPGGAIVCNAETVRPGEELEVWLQAGRLSVQVTGVEEGRVP